MDEKWVSVKDFDNYEVSNTGRVKNKKTGRVLKTTKDNKGYDTVKLSVHGVQKTRRVNKLVADAFLETNPSRSKIRYRDGNKDNNNADNLELVRRGKRVLVKETNKIYDSVSECSQELGVARATVSKCSNYSFYGNRSGYHFETVE